MPVSGGPILYISTQKYSMMEIGLLVSALRIFSHWVLLSNPNLSLIVPPYSKAHAVCVILGTFTLSLSQCRCLPQGFDVTYTGKMENNVPANGAT